PRPRTRLKTADRTVKRTRKKQPPVLPVRNNIKTSINLRPHSDRDLALNYLLRLPRQPSPLRHQHIAPRNLRPHTLRRPLQRTTTGRTRLPICSARGTTRGPDATDTATSSQGRRHPNYCLGTHARC